MSDPAKPETPPNGPAVPAPPDAGPAAARPGVPVTPPATPKPGVSGAAATQPRPAPPRPVPPRPEPGRPDTARPDTARPEPGRAAQPSRTAGVVLTAFAVALLAGGLAVVWQRQQQMAEDAVASADLAALREQVRGLQQRVAQGEQRPAPSIDLRPLEARIAALEQRGAATPATADPALAARVAALEQRPASPAVDPALAGQVAALAQRAAQAEQAATRAAQSAAGTIRLAALQRAAAALDAGQAVGEIPGAPPALSRFATVPPPTLAGLRQSFAAAASRARDASHAEGAATGIADRAWQRLRGLVTVRAGDTVLLGTPAAKVLGHAGGLLAAGDLGGAVAALDALDPGAAAAMAPWRAEAQALLDARAALAALRAQ